MIYVTLLDQFHPGIYSSQVLDVCDHLNKKFNANIRVVAFLSLRELYRSDAKKQLKALSPNAMVLPSFPGLRYFEWTAFLLFFVCLFTGERVAICRNVFCTRMALRVKRMGLLKKVVMDGRSAMAAEIGEYNVFPVNYLKQNVQRFERSAVNQSDFRMSVSEQLINYWREKYDYFANDHVIIPCTLDTKYFSEDHFLLSDQVPDLRSALGFRESDIILAYSGSTAPWQSFELLESMLTPILDQDERIKILFLSKLNNDTLKLQTKYGNRVVVKWLQHKEVLAHLHCCDYGILVREQSDTNKVASPVKFAEYLYSGLEVLISENLGDFSDFVRINNCGHVVGEASNKWPKFEKITLAQKQHCFLLAHKFFKKGSTLNDIAYQKLLKHIETND